MACIFLLKDAPVLPNFEEGVISYKDAIRNADSQNDVRLQIKLHSKRSANPDLASGTEHLAVV